MPGTFSPSMEMLFQRLLMYCSSPVDIEVALEEVRKLHDEATSHSDRLQIEACLCATINYEPRLAPRVGTLIGQLTLAQDRPILARVCDVRFLLKQVLDTSPRRSCRRFISSNTTFCVRILEGAAGSKVFNLKNPWMQAVLGDLQAIRMTQPVRSSGRRISTAALEIDKLFERLGFTKLEKPGRSGASKPSPPPPSPQTIIEMIATAEIEPPPLSEAIRMSMDMSRIFRRPTYSTASSSYSSESSHPEDDRSSVRSSSDDEMLPVGSCEGSMCESDCSSRPWLRCRQDSREDAPFPFVC